jgi:hypothetical protein
VKGTLIRFVGALCIAAPFVCTSALAADKEMTGQQSKMATCNQDAGDKKGDERKAFMKTCLSAKKMTQQDKMKMCNKDAAGKKGDERKAFMSDCLKG